MRATRARKEQKERERHQNSFATVFMTGREHKPWEACHKRAVDNADIERRDDALFHLYDNEGEKDGFIALNKVVGDTPSTLFPPISSGRPSPSVEARYKMARRRAEERKAPILLHSTSSSSFSSTSSLPRLPSIEDPTTLSSARKDENGELNMPNSAREIGKDS